MDPKDRDLDGILILREANGSLSLKVGYNDTKTQEAVTRSGRSIFYFIDLKGVNGKRPALTSDVAEIIDDFNSRAYSQDEAIRNFDEVKERYSHSH